MLMFAELLRNAAEDAGIKVPEDTENFDPYQYPHFHIFCAAQLDRKMTPGAHWENAKIIASLTNEECLRVTESDLIDKGWKI